MIKSVLILDEFFAMTAKIRTLFLSHIKITNYLTLKHGTFNLRHDVFVMDERKVLNGCNVPVRGKVDSVSCLSASNPQVSFSVAIDGVAWLAA